jgi:predicted RNA-binding protein (TIGR00451 family)
LTGKYFINKILFTMDYLFGDDISKIFEEREIKYELSNNTNRLRFIYVDDKLFATIRANGTYALTIHGAGILINYSDYMKNCVMINNEIEQFIKVGGSVFNKHVIDAGDNILLDSEAIIINENKKLIGVGKALTSHDIMKKSKIGPAIKVRHI